jgi:hypothetical protein
MLAYRDHITVQGKMNARILQSDTSLRNGGNVDNELLGGELLGLFNYHNDTISRISLHAESHPCDLSSQGSSHGTTTSASESTSSTSSIIQQYHDTNNRICLTLFSNYTVRGIFSNDKMILETISGLNVSFEIMIVCIFACSNLKIVCFAVPIFQAFRIILPNGSEFVLDISSILQQFDEYSSSSSLGDNETHASSIGNKSLSYDSGITLHSISSAEYSHYVPQIRKNFICMLSFKRYYTTPNELREDIYMNEKQMTLNRNISNKQSLFYLKHAKRLIKKYHK